MTPNSTPKRAQEIPDDPKGRSKPVLDFQANFGSMLVNFGSQNGCQHGPQNRSKIDFGAPGPPRGLLGAIWEPFWNHFGPMFDPCWSPVGAFGGTSLPPNSRKHCSKSLVKRTFETTAGQRRRRPWLGGRFGARMRPLDPATEPLGARGGRVAKRILKELRDHFAKAQF